MKSFLAASALLILVLGACAPAERPVETTAEPAAAESVPIPTVPSEGGTVVRRLESDVNTLNPLLQSSSYERYVLSYLFDAVVELDQDLNVIPMLATKWEISPDGKTYTFTLDPKSKWSDGKPVRASDMVFTLKKIVDPASQTVQFAGLFEGLDLKNTKALDEQTVQVVFDKARAAQLLAFNIPILPEHVYSRGKFTRDFNSKVVGNGPYKLEKREIGREIVLVRRDDYPGRRPYLERVLFKYIDDDTTAWNALKLGEIDETTMTSDQWKMERDLPQVKERIEVRRYYHLGYNFIPWNTCDPILADPAVRRALTMCVDRRSIISNIYYGTARLVTGPFVPDQWAYNPEVKPLEYDPKEARKVFEDAGWVDSDNDGVLDRGGKKFIIEMLIPSGNKASGDQAQIVQSTFKEVGVQMDIVRLDSPTFLQRVLEGKYQAAFLAWDLDLDPDPYALFHSSQFPPAGQNIGYYSNPEVDKLLEAARIEMDQAKRQDLYHQIHARLAEDQPYTWLVQISRKWGFNRRLQNVNEAKGIGYFGWYPGPLGWWIPEGQRSQGKAFAESR
ncbi:MAG: ABC transporter substrate-binding protein [Thermoanaerobaculia bacterium]